ncbi:transposase [Priestia megaterium]|uniref:Transposase n=1 Tax=Priestia megaterium TaxID=1404 RepID=A0A6M6E981_PRIMG|nr:transposase [Priestia megaterium]QJX81107.1 transposase [Priestia megaterium]
MGRKVYNRQFKMAAVQLVLEENLFVKEVAKELSIHPNTLYRWISEYEEYGESAYLSSLSVNGETLIIYKVLYCLLNETRNISERKRLLFSK